MGTKVRLAVACGDYEIVRALKEGAVEADGLDLVVLTGHGPRERHWRMGARKWVGSLVQPLTLRV